ncbi:MAG: hypothetical protein KDJ97_24115 [Anaerolineae bacterium]|nr:hypothetical protein [Anaerolineae bacterium]
MKNLFISQTEKKLRMNVFYSIRGKLLLFFLGLSLLPLALVGTLAYWESQRVLRTRITHELEMRALFEADIVERWFSSRLTEIEVMASSKEVQSMDPNQIQEIIVLYTQKWNHYETLFVANAEGMIVAANIEGQFNISDRDYFQKAIQGTSNISDAIISRGTGHPIVVVATSIVVDGQVVGVVGGAVPTTELAEILSQAQVGETGESYMVNQDGYFITPSRFTEDLVEQGVIEERIELEL